MNKRMSALSAFTVFMLQSANASADKPTHHIELRVSFDMLQTVAECGATVDECPDWTWAAIRDVTRMMTPRRTSDTYEVVVDPNAPRESVTLWLDGKRSPNHADEYRAQSMFFFTMGKYVGASSVVSQGRKDIQL